MSSSSSHAASSSRKRRRVVQAYDVFISHAGPDKKTIAKPLYEKLDKLGISAFVDEEEMLPGRQAPLAMMEAMETAAIGVFILSADFVARKWPVKELRCFLERAEKAALRRREKPVLIPVFYRLRIDQCHHIESLLDLHEGGKSPFIVGRFIQRQAKGEPEANLRNLQLAFNSLVERMGITNLDNVTNEVSDAMTEKRGRLVDKVVDGVEKALKERNGPVEKSCRPSHSAPNVAVETTDSFQARFDVPVPLPNIVLNWGCDSDGEPMTMEGRLKKEIMDSTQDLDSSVVAAVDGAPIGVCGHGGVGKTSALIGMGREEDVQRHFNDGVYFVKVGGGATDGSMIGALALLVRECGGVKTCNQISNCKSLGEATQLAAGYFRGKRALFMFDDMWCTEKSAVGYLKEIRQLVATCPQSRILVSTRSNCIARAGRRQVVFEPRDAEGRVAREMLCRSAEIETEEMWEYKKELRTVLRFCKGLPLTLQVAGCAIRARTDAETPLCGAIQSYVRDLHGGIRRPAMESGEEYLSFQETVCVSLRMADQWYRRVRGDRVRSESSVSELYERLAVIGSQMHAPRSMLKVLWGLETEKEADMVLEKLKDLNLVKCRAKGDEMGVELHDLLLEFCEHAAGEKVKEHHADVLSGYYKMRKEDAMQGDERGSGIRSGRSTDVEEGVRCWWEDRWSRGYIGENVCRHLAGAGKCEELAILLTDARWALAQVRKRRLLGWVGDFDELFKAMQKRKTGGAEGLNLEKARKGLELDERWAPEKVIKRRLLRWMGNFYELFGAIQKRETEEAEGLDLEKVRKGLELVRDGVREAWNHVARNEREFGWQMYARLVDQGEGKWPVRRLLKSISRHAERPWLRPTSRCFPVPGGKRYTFPCDKEVKAVAFLESKAVVGAGDDVLIVNLETGEREKTLGEHGGAERVARDVGMERDEQGRDVACAHTSTVSCVAVSGNGRRIVSGSRDKTLRVWDAWSGICVSKPLRGHESVVSCVAVSEDGGRIVSGTYDGTLRVWDAESGKCVGELLRGHTHVVSCVAMSRDGRRIVSGSWDGTLRVWDAGGGECVIGPLRGHTLGVSCVVLSEDEGRIVSGSYDGTLRVWDARSGECEGGPLRGHDVSVNCVAVSADGRRIVSGCSWGTLRVWDAGSGKCVGGPLRGHKLMVTCVAVSADGQRIVSGSDDTTLRVWDMESAERVVEPARDYDGGAKFVAVSGGGRRFVSGSDNGTLRVRGVGSGEAVVEPVRDSKGIVDCVAVSEDGRRFVSGLDDGTLRVWDAGSGGFVGKSLRGHTEGVWCVAMSRDGRRIVSGSGDKTVRVWDVGSGKVVGEPFRGHTEGVWCVAMSRDGRRVVSGSGDKTVRVWDVEHGECVGEPLRGHKSALRCVVVSGDGQRIVSWEDWQVSRVWDMQSGRPVGPPQQHNYVVDRAMTIGTMVVGYGVNGAVKWELDETAGLVKVQSKGEDDVLSVWCHIASSTVEMRYQGRKVILATLPVAPRYSGWLFDLRHRNFAAGFGGGWVFRNELVL